MKKEDLITTNWMSLHHLSSFLKAKFFLSKKKEAILFLFILTFTLASAQPDLIFQNQTFQPGETLLGTINAQNLVNPITKNNIKFFRGQKAIFIEHDITFYNNTYFFYAILPDEGNISIIIPDILYRAPELKSITIEKQIQIQKEFLDENQTKTEILSIKPGLLFTSETPKITLSNIGTEELEINYNQETLTLQPNDFKQISFTPEKSFSYLTISTYQEFKIPIIYISSDNQTIPLIPQTYLRANPTSLELKTTTNNQSQEEIQLINFANTDITDITISKTLKIMDFQTPQQIPAKEIFPLKLSFYSTEQGFFTDKLIINFSQTEDNLTEQKSISIPINVYVFPQNSNLSNIQTGETCAELFGQVCTADQICEFGDTTFDSKGDYCCIGGICQDIITDSKSSSWLIAIIIIIVLGIISFFIYKKIKKTKPKPAEQQFKEKSKLYEKRVAGKLIKE